MSDGESGNDNLFFAHESPRESQKEMIAEEAGNIESMPDWKARVLGLRKNDII